VSPPRRLRNLPTKLTTFIGRDQEIAEVKRLLGTSRLLTLTGSGGCGKTRLALQVAADSVDQHPDGVWFVDLAPLADPAFVPNSVATALGVPEQPTRPVTDTLADYLRMKILLLVLDNCEHLRAACQSLADHVLRASNTVRILATSRETLGVEGESTYRVPPLRLPDVRQAPPVAHLAEYDAVRLFAERAALAQPEFTVTASNAPATVQICRQLDGMPLAIEFAAARVRTLSVEQIAARLDDRFRLLTAGTRQTVPRQQTLRATMDWSYDLLSEQEQAVLRRLSVFAGGWTVEAAEAVCEGDGVGVSDIFDLVTQLVDKSLVIAETQHREARYRLLETVREYAGDRLTESRETAAVRSRHRAWYLQFAEQAEPKLRGPEQRAWGERLDAEHDNLRVALAWSKTDKDGAEAWLRLAGALHWFWFMRGYSSEGREWLEAALATPQDVSAPVRAKALHGAGLLAWRQGDFERAGILLHESLSRARALRDNWGIGFSLHLLAHLAERPASDFRKATDLFEESLARFRESGDAWGVGLTLECMGLSALTRGDYGRASALLEGCLPIWREVGDTSELSATLNGLGIVAERQGDYKRATGLLEEGLALAQHVGSKHQVPFLQFALANVALRLGDRERAVMLYRESLILRRDIGEKPQLARCLEGLAGVACVRRRYDQAARILGAADALRDAIGYRRAPFDQADYDERVAVAQERLGESAFAAALVEGRTMRLEQAIEYALECASPTVSQAAGNDKLGRTVVALTTREREVAELIARGLTNRQIAATMVVTERTAETHVHNILNKLGVTSRAQIAVWATEQGLRAPAE